MLTQQAGPEPPTLSTGSGSCSPFLWICDCRRMGLVLGERPRFRRTTATIIPASLRKDSSGGARAHERGANRTTPTDARGVEARRRAGPDRATARAGQADGARAARPAARSRIVRGAGRVRHPPVRGLRPRRAAHPRRRRRHRARHDRRTARVRLLAGLHRLRRVAVRGLRREDLQGDGPGDEGRRTDRRASTIRAGRGSRRASCRSAAMPTSSCATRSPRASCRSCRSSWGRAPAAPCIRRRSPTSRSWSRARATCS